MTEAELIDGLIRNDRNATRQLVALYQRQVIKTAYHFVQDMQDAEDISQEVFLDILKNIGGFRKKAALGTWIYRITVNRSLGHMKRANRRGIFSRFTLFSGSLPEDKSPDPSIGSNPAGSYEARESERIISASVGKLPENQRIAFVLSKFDGRSYQEISEIMGVSIPSVESLLHRAKQNLQKRLSGHFPEYKRD
jgi:RNA polymerase sigma factor (sigma-70 family)